MSIQIVIHFKKLFNGKTLPKSLNDEEDGVVFYDFVFRQKSEDLMRIPFVFGNVDETCYLFMKDVKIPSKLLMCDNCTRVVDNEEPIEIHLYKYLKIGNELGMERITTLDSQDEAIFKINFHKHRKIDFLTFHEAPPKKSDYFSPIDRLRIKDTIVSPYWKTQRDFYSRLHKSLNMEIQRENYERLLRFYDHSNEMNILGLVDFFTKWGKFMEPCAYRSDVEWFDKRKYTDKGDAAIESTKKGDCEDFAHYYIRMFYLMLKTYKFFNIPKIAKFCDSLKKNYHPYVYICKIIVTDERTGKQEEQYHSTILILPMKKLPHNPVVSFEVTNNDEHSIVISPKSSFYKWHLDSYFLVDSYHIFRIKEHDKIKDLIVNDIKDQFFNF
jgi:hypothetical protein